MSIKSILTPNIKLMLQFNFSKQKLMFPLALSQETTVHRRLTFHSKTKKANSLFPPFRANKVGTPSLIKPGAHILAELLIC